MNKTSKKLVGGLMVVILVATIGVIIVGAQTDETSREITEKTGFWGRQKMCGPAPFASNVTKIGPFFFNLTEEQQTELNDLVKNLKDQGANSSEIRKAIQEKLDEWGVLDKQLDNEIAQTEQRLEILNREKELRNQGDSWEEINQIIQDEFGIKAPVGDDQDMMFGHGFGRGQCRGPHDFMSDEDSK